MHFGEVADEGVHYDGLTEHALLVSVEETAETELCQIMHIMQDWVCGKGGTEDCFGFCLDGGERLVETRTYEANMEMKKTFLFLRRPLTPVCPI